MNSSAYDENTSLRGKEPAILVHCKAGKGRTGQMICALLLFINFVESADQALAHYDSMRTSDNKGVSIAS